MHKRCNLIITIITFILLLSQSASSWAEASFVVSDIRIEGLERLPDGTLLNYLPVRQGDPLDGKQITFAIKALYKTGFFANVELFRDGGVLVVKVKERPSISDVTFSGNSDVGSEQLEEQLKDFGIVKGKIYNRSLLGKLSQGLEQFYFSTGKYGVRIETEVTELDQNRVDIEIDISEGQVALIKDINIIGNKVFDDETLMDEMELGIPGAIDIFSSSDEYSKPKLNADIETLRSHYLDRGYIKFSADSTQVSITPDKKDIYITINVEEGGQYFISKVNLTGLMVVEKKQLEKLILTKEGELFSRKEMTGTEKRLQDRVGMDGYAFARVRITPDINDETNTIVLNYELIPGKKVYVRQINFHGNYRTQDKVLRREMRLMEGSVLASNKLERSKIRLQRLRFLGDINVETIPVQGTEDQVDIEVTVEEQLSGSFNIGAGFSQNQGLLFNVGLTQDNLFGTGQSMSINVNTDSANTIYNVSFTDPYHTIDGISRTVSASFRERDASEEDINDFQTDSYSANINYGIPLTEFDSIRLGYGISHIDIQLGVFPSQEVGEFVTANGNVFDSFTLSAGYTHDTRNRTVFASRGSQQSVAININAPGSDLEYYKLSYTTKFYFGLTDSLTLLMRSNLAYGDGYADTVELPFYERYFAGGLRTVRGYDSNSLGPRDLNTNDPIGGNMRVTAGADLIFPVPFVDKAPRTVRFSAFYDIGNVFLDDTPTFNSEKNGFDSSQLRAAAGLSFVWLAPIGPLRFSWSRALNDEIGDNLRIFQFSIGSFF